jgi:hypothetical protein
MNSKFQPASSAALIAEPARAAMFFSSTTIYYAHAKSKSPPCRQERDKDGAAGRNSHQIVFKPQFPSQAVQVGIDRGLGDAEQREPLLQERDTLTLTQNNEFE